MLSTMAIAKPVRVVSVNLCSDELLLLLADKEQIASLSYLSRDAQYSNWANAAEHFPVNYSGAEEVIALKPDLVLAGQYSNPMLIRLLQQQGINVQIVPRASTMEDLFVATKQVGAALGQIERTEQMVLKWQTEIDGIIEQHNADVRQPSMAILGPNGFTEGKGSLRDQMLQQVGIKNIASDLGMVGNAEFTLEQIILANPDMIAIEDTTENRHSLAQRFLEHDALTQLSSEVVALPARLWSCPGPSYVTALRGLHEAKLNWMRVIAK